MWLALAGSRPPTFLADYVRNVLRPQLQTIPGVGEIRCRASASATCASGTTRRGSRPRA